MSLGLFVALQFLQPWIPIFTRSFIRTCTGMVGIFCYCRRWCCRRRNKILLLTKLYLNVGVVGANCLLQIAVPKLIGQKALLVCSTERSYCRLSDEICQFRINSRSVRMRKYELRMKKYEINEMWFNTTLRGYEGFKHPSYNNFKFNLRVHLVTQLSNGIKSCAHHSFKSFQSLFQSRSRFHLHRIRSLIKMSGFRSRSECVPRGRRACNIDIEIVCIVGAINNAVDIIHGWIDFIIEKRHVNRKRFGTEYEWSE